MKQIIMKTFIATFLLSIFLCFNTKANYSFQEQQAYHYAFSKNITSRDSITKAGMNQYITRSEIAKMLSNWAKSFWHKVDTSKQCNFADTAGVYWDLKDAIIESCQLWILGQWAKNFRPYDYITKAEVSTAVSRILWWNKYDWGSPYYVKHMSNLDDHLIILGIEDPTENETRWNVMLMLVRADWNLWLSTNKILDDLKAEGKTIHYIKEDYLEVGWEEEFGCVRNENSGTCSVTFIMYDNWELANWVYVEKYDDWKISSIFEYKNWRLEGTSYTFYETWQLASKSGYKEWKMFWESFSYYENWQLRFMDVYDNEWYIEDGISTWYYEDWRILSLSAYESWAPILSIHYYKNGNVMSISRLDAYSPVWEGLFYYENGNLKELITYNTPWRPDGKWETYYENGSLQSEWYYKNWWKEWDWTIYNEKWEVISIETYHYWELQSTR